MKLNKLIGDDAGVSPVIGVILMVAITVILAAVIGTFVLSGDLLGEPAPQVNWDYSYDSDDNNVTVVHDGGDEVAEGTLSIAGDVSAENEDNGPYSAGDSFVVGDDGDFDTDDVESGDTIRLVWSSGDGSSSTIGTYTTP